MNSSIGAVARLKHTPRIRRHQDALGVSTLAMLPGPGLVLVEYLRGLFMALRLEYERERRQRGQMREPPAMSRDEFLRALNS